MLKSLSLSPLFRTFVALLHELGLRKAKLFVEANGAALIRDGTKAFQDLIGQADRGVLFIDEAHRVCNLSLNKI